MWAHGHMGEGGGASGDHLFLTLATPFKSLPGPQHTPTSSSTLHLVLPTDFPSAPKQPTSISIARDLHPLSVPPSSPTLRSSWTSRVFFVGLMASASSSLSSFSSSSDRLPPPPSPPTPSPPPPLPRRLLLLLPLPLSSSFFLFLSCFLLPFLSGCLGFERPLWPGMPSALPRAAPVARVLRAEAKGEQRFALPA